MFVDSGAWFAIQVSDDAHHRAARQVFPVILERCRSLVTSNLVIGETYTLLRITKGYREAKQFLDTLAHSNKLERMVVTEHLEQQAYGILERFSGHAFSFVDATSFALMRQARMRHAFAF
ncbi:MAG: PIN domain-containing protein, partial [Pseudomonadota bacterium]